LATGLRGMTESVNTIFIKADNESFKLATMTEVEILSAITYSAMTGNDCHAMMKEKTHADDAKTEQGVCCMDTVVEFRETGFDDSILDNSNTRQNKATSTKRKTTLSTLGPDEPIRNTTTC